MRRYMRKPRTMTTREFSARVNELNGYLKHFPPFDQDQELTEEELLDLLEFGVPNAWQKNMVLQWFDPVIHTPSELVAFCECQEFTEGNLNNSEDKKGTKPKPVQRTVQPTGNLVQNPLLRSQIQTKKRRPSEKWFDLHQTHGHDTTECKVVQAQISKMRQSRETVRPDSKFKSKDTDNKF
jgi:hypothetical protein